MCTMSVCAVIMSVCLSVSQIELQEELAITDFKGNEQGHLGVEILPCMSDGSLPTPEDDLFMEQPENMVSAIHYIQNFIC